ncbi:MAG: hypothetical protein KAI97_09680 [Gemmatimonadetes bacterium]|nr:hypothetical protein [Gemmatimonadota bacterium]
MRNILLGALALVIIGSIAVFIAKREQSSPTRQREHLEKQFMACVPDSLDDARRDEIGQLFDSFWFRYDRGMVDPADAEEITGRMTEIVEAGSVNGKDLIYFVAQVGFYTYKMDKHYTPSDSVDHPTLNPSSAMVHFGFDSTMWDDFYKWKTEQIKAGKLPGYTLEDTLR